MDPAVLKPILAKLTADVHAQHVSGAGGVRLLDIAALLQLPLNAAQQQALEQRGEIGFRATGPDGGVFENLGAEVRVDTPLATLIVPPKLAGTYGSTAESLHLFFTPGETFAGKKGFLTAPLKALHATPQQFAVEIGGVLGAALSRTVVLQ